MTTDESADSFGAEFLVAEAADGSLGGLKNLPNTLRFRLIKPILELYF